MIGVNLFLGSLQGCEVRVLHGVEFIDGVEKERCLKSIEGTRKNAFIIWNVVAHCCCVVVVFVVLEDL